MVSFPSPSLSGIFPHSLLSAVLPLSSWVRNWLCLGIFPSHPRHAIVPLCSGGCLRAKVARKKERKITNILLHFPDQGLLFPVPLAREMGYFLAVGLHDAQQQISVLMRSNLRSGQGGKKRQKDTRNIPFHSFFSLKGPLS